MFRSGEASPGVGAGAPLRGGGEEAAFGVEDGDCVEAAEKPPELMPGERTGRTPTQNLEQNAPNYGINNHALLTK